MNDFEERLVFNRNNPKGSQRYWIDKYRKERGLPPLPQTNFRKRWTRQDSGGDGTSIPISYHPRWTILITRLSNFYP